MATLNSHVNGTNDIPKWAQTASVQSRSSTFHEDTCAEDPQLEWLRIPSRKPIDPPPLADFATRDPRDPCWIQGLPDSALCLSGVQQLDAWAEIKKQGIASRGFKTLSTKQQNQDQDIKMVKTTRKTTPSEMMIEVGGWIDR